MILQIFRRFLNFFGPKSAALEPSGRRRQQGVPEYIRKFFIPTAILEATSRIMGRFGYEKRECYVWWGGYFNSDGVAHVLTAYSPIINTSYGRVHLQNQDLVAMHQELRNRDQLLIAELHTHPPGAGGQNEVDAAHPAAPYPGFISIVVPNFAHPRFDDLTEAFVYEYIKENRWRTLDSSEIRKRFVIEDSFVEVRTHSGTT